MVEQQQYKDLQYSSQLLRLNLQIYQLLRLVQTLNFQIILSLYHLENTNINSFKKNTISLIQTYKIIMFEPNSIRSMLKKRNMSKLNSENDNHKQQVDKMSKTCSDFSSISKNNTDPDLQSVLEAKLMIKQIDNQVSNIRIWRQHQKQLLQQRLKNNTDLFNLSKEEYEKYVDYTIEQEIMNNNKIIEKIKIQENRLNRNQLNNNSFLIDNGNASTLESSEAGQIIYEDWEGSLYDPQLMKSIAMGEDKINQKKHMKAEIYEGLEDRHQAFLNSINQLTSSDIFNKKYNENENKPNDQNKPSNSFDKQKLKKQLQDIDAQLKEMEDLLRD